MSAATVEVADFFEQQSIHELVSWLLIAFTSNRFDPLELADRPAATIQLQRGFEQATPQAQERLKQAVVRAISEWSPHAHGLETLHRLASLAAYIRASRAVGALRPLLESVLLERASLHKEELGWHRTTAWVIAVLHGFAPHEEVEALFERWLFEDTDPRYYGQFFIGVCACRAGAFTEVFPRMVELADRYPSAVELPYLVSQLVQTLGLYMLARALKHMQAPLHERLLEWLTEVEDAPVEIVFHEQHGDCLVDTDAPPERRTYYPIPLDAPVAYRVKSRSVTDPVGMIEQMLMLESPASPARPTAWN